MSSELRLQQKGYPVAALLAVMFVGSLLPFFALILSGARQHMAEERGENFAQLSRQSAVLAEALERELRVFLKTAQVTAQSNTLRQSDIAEQTKHLRGAAQYTGGHFILVDRSFRQLVNTAAPEGAALPQAADADAAHLVFATGQPMVRDLATGPFFTEPFFSVRAPVVVDGNIVYVLTYVPRKTALADVLDRTFRPQDWLASIVDTQGRVVAHSDDPRRYGAKSVWQLPTDHPPGAVLEAVDEKGRPAFVTRSQSRLSGWQALVWEPKAPLDARMNKFIAAASRSVIFALIGSAVAAVLSALAIRTALRRLAAAAEQVGESSAFYYRAGLVREANQVAASLSVAANHITAREQELRTNEERIQTIVHELNHRSKNLLAIIQVIARQSARRCTDVPEFLRSFSERLAGIARSHDILTERGWGAVPIMELMDAHMGPFLRAGGRVKCSGPDVALQASAAQDIGMVLHELATNAAKYGALSTSSGRIEIEWQKTAAPSGKQGLELRWTEVGGPAVTPPARKGFGHTLLERVVASIGGSADVDWRKDGLTCTIILPHACLSEQPGGGQ
ncbi:MAG: sensor histidine kinase [Hyphomicrobiaceae bacterium]|nr:sensor histidine kinase [Hyphomicrobiaceae bacterium]